VVCISIYLSKFPHKADCPKDATVTDENAFEQPTKEMGQSENIYVVPDLLPVDVRAIYSIFLKRNL
jgi:hypothetical protein